MTALLISTGLLLVVAASFVAGWLSGRWFDERRDRLRRERAITQYVTGCRVNFAAPDAGTPVASAREAGLL